mmetsp:Transcript_31340/g.50418  ORF Transcript_31340/g.50418 Transcript_31340/m.50418 type:complete len:179 (-) Transcript_31340:111-647(-)
MKISTILSILLHTCVSADPFRNKFHVASMDEISEKSSELVYLGQQLVFQNGVPIDISVYQLEDRWIRQIKSLQLQLDECLGKRALDPNSVDTSALFQAFHADPNPPRPVPVPAKPATAPLPSASPATHVLQEKLKQKEIEIERLREEIKRRRKPGCPGTACPRKYAIFVELPEDYSFE